MTTASDDISVLFLEFSRKKLFGEYWPRMRECVESLSDEQVWWRPNEVSNSIGNLLLHLNGNISQWIVASFNRAEFARNRPLEFSERRQVPAKEMIAQLDATLKEAESVLARLTAADLAGHYEIQGLTVTGLHAVYQVVEHFGRHFGQVVYITKLVRGQDLGFYKELNTTGRFEPQKPQ